VEKILKHFHEYGVEKITLKRMNPKTHLSMPLHLGMS